MSVVKNGLPVPHGEDHDAALLEVAYRAATDVRLGHFADRDRGQDPGLRAEPLERVLHGQAVEERRQHPGVVGGRPVHALGGRREAAVDVAGTDHDRHLDAPAGDPVDLPCDGRDPIRVDPVLLGAHERLAGELEENALEDRLAGCDGAACRAVVRRRPHSATAYRTNSRTSAPCSASALATVSESS